MPHAEYYGQTRSEVARFLPDRYEKVLEIGCGEGGFRGNLKEICEYWGVEPVKSVADAASRRLFKVLNGTFDQVSGELPDDYFDLIICNDVIEHIADTDGFFAGIKGKMKPDASLVGSIPNVRFFGNLRELLLERDWRYKEEGILDKTHLRFFTKKSLQRVFAENDFIVEEFGGINALTIKLLSPKQFLTRAVMSFLGADTKFLQFGFRVRKNSVRGGG